MKVLRDESGQVLLGLASETESKPAVQPSTPAAASAARPTQHCCFHCGWCGAILCLPHDRLGLVFSGPALRRIQARSIATVCNSCRHVAAFSLFRGALGYDTRHRLTAMHPSGNTILVDILRCEEATCAYPLSLFLTSEGELTGDIVQDLGNSWDWENLSCASGHPILRPRWLYDTRPLHFPPQLK